MRIAFIPATRLIGRSSWSQTSSFAYKEIRRRFPEIHLIDTPRLDKVMHLVGRVLKKVGIDIYREPLVTRAYAQIIESELERVAPDAVVSIITSHKIADITSRWPVVLIADGLFSTIINYYPKYSSLSARSKKLGNAVAQRAIERTRAILLASQWAVKAARRDYQFGPETRLRCVPFGANLEVDPGCPRPLDPDPATRGPLKLLFVGQDWERKGGPLALEVFALLREYLPDAEFHIVGCRPKGTQDQPGVSIHGFLSKANPAEYGALTNLYAESSLFFMPCNQEAFGIVFCEACAYGLPSVARLTGGINTSVRDEVNGLLFDTNATAEDYAVRIEDLWNDRPRWLAMREAARAAYETRLNWTAWGDAVEEELHAIQLSK